MEVGNGVPDTEESDQDIVFLAEPTVSDSYGSSCVQNIFLIQEHLVTAMDSPQVARTDVSKNLFVFSSHKLVFINIFYCLKANFLITVFISGFTYFNQLRLKLLVAQKTFLKV